MLLSIVTPCYNEEEVLKGFYDEAAFVASSLKNKFDLETEFVFVNDGSKDGTLNLIKEFNKSDARVRFVSFSRNFGKEAALLAGLNAANGDLIAVMDADLQDPPSYLIDMADEILNKGFDVCAARRVTRKGEPPVRSFFARNFYKTFNKISEVKLTDGARDFRMVTRKVLDEILRLNEKNRFIKGLFSFVGFKTKWIEYENVNRAAGKSKWSFSKLMKYSFEGLFAFSTAPLFLPFYAMVFSVILSAAFVTFTALAAAKVLFVPYLSLFAVCSLICVFATLGFLTALIACQYIAKIHTEVKKRPIYIVSESSDEQKQEKP